MKNTNWGIMKNRVIAEETKQNSQPVGGIIPNDTLEVYFEKDVDTAPIAELIKSLREKEKISLSIAANYEILPPPIKLYITSYGGIIANGFAASDVIRTLKVPVHTIVMGCAASAATLISCVGTKRFIYKRSRILIHQLSGGAWGKFNEIKDDIKNLTQYHEMILDFYKEYTKVPEKQLDEVLSHDLWWNAKTALRYGLVDEIL